jgi:hypothetical protein
MIWLFARLGLPHLDAPEQPDPSTHREYEEFTKTFVDPPGSAEGLGAPGDTTSYLRWLATHRQVLFHGSQRDNISELAVDRESTDSTTFGNQRAVFATDDPIWAMWFALLTRGPGFRSTRNGVWTIRHDPLTRQYFFSVNTTQSDEDLFTDGWLYVLPRDGFTPEPPFAGLLQSGQWVNLNPVAPLARLAVSPSDFPFRDVIGRHTDADSILRTLRNARAAFRGRLGS